MTMSVRITNESIGTNYVTNVKVIDTHSGGPVIAETFDLLPGESKQVYLTSTRGLVVEESEMAITSPAPDADATPAADVDSDAITLTESATDAVAGSDVGTDACTDSNTDYGTVACTDNSSNAE